jgi:hypothetical protein
MYVFIRLRVGRERRKYGNCTMQQKREKNEEI